MFHVFIYELNPFYQSVENSTGTYARTHMMCLIIGALIVGLEDLKTDPLPPRKMIKPTPHPKKKRQNRPLTPRKPTKPTLSLIHI